MKRIARWSLLATLLSASTLALPNEAVHAQTTDPSGAEAPETFVPSERLPADSAVSFPVDI